ncbi:conserved protein of unknown function [Tenacibaculum sp. 190524A02b]|uniref:hypothetical protein n=1 Tax=Tenacibaculum vairaonense TaxID=3137860 RepID=UPI0032B13F2A
MKNKQKIEQLKKKIIELERNSINHDKGYINDKEYSAFLKSEISNLKKDKIQEMKLEIEKGVKEVNLLIQIKQKLESNQKLNEKEKKFILNL